MAETSGFFDAQLGSNGVYDRLYDADTFGSMFDGIVSDGIFVNIGSSLAVSAGTSGLSVKISAGKAWLMHTWYYNSSTLTKDLSEASSSLPRIDSIVIDVDKTTNVRANKIKVLTGQPASSPSAPSLVNTTTHRQYLLANIRVNANATSIDASNITDKRGTSGGCPFLAYNQNSITVDNLLSQWQAQYNTLYAQMEAAIAAAGSLTIPDQSVSEVKIQYGALYRVVSVRLLTNFAWTQNSYGTYTGVCTSIGNLDPAKHYGILTATRKLKKPGDANWSFSTSYMDEDEEALANIFSAQISAVNTITLTAREMPTANTYISIGVCHI